MASSKFKLYYKLTKPGIIYGNLLTAAAGFVIALRHPFNFKLFVLVLLSTSLVIGSACVFNNIIDKDIDSKMKRTKTRALVSGEVTTKNALIYGTILGIIGFLILLSLINFITFLIGLIAFVDYVFLYGYAKRKSIYGTLVGTIAGSASIVAGYSAATNSLNLCALLLFLVMTFWQMPHFYAIALYRKQDYKDADIPVMPVVKGNKRTRIEIIIYSFLFLLALIGLRLFGYVDNLFIIVVGAIAVYWFGFGLKGIQTSETEKWARKMFKISLFTLLIMCTMIFLRLIY
jgi:protoheme IX farnesyltransferase